MVTDGFETSNKIPLSIGIKKAKSAELGTMIKAVLDAKREDAKRTK